jgi:hypothetical protein
MIGFRSTYILPVSQVYMEDVKSDFNVGRSGIDLALAPGSEVTMDNVKARYQKKESGIAMKLFEGSKATLKNVEASYNYYGAEIRAYSFESQPDKVAEVILEGTNFFNGNKYDGFKGQIYQGFDEGKLDVVVSKGTTNASNNDFLGLYLQGTSKFTPTLNVKKGGAVNACGNKEFDIKGFAKFFHSSGKHYTCGSTENNSGFTCGKTCPVCE